MTHRTTEYSTDSNSATYNTASGWLLFIFLTCVVSIVESNKLSRKWNYAGFLSQQAQTVGEMIETLKDFLILTLM